MVGDVESYPDVVGAWLQVDAEHHGRGAFVHRDWERTLRRLRREQLVSPDGLDDQVGQGGSCDVW